MIIKESAENYLEAVFSIKKEKAIQIPNIKDIAPNKIGLKFNSGFILSSVNVFC